MFVLFECGCQGISLPDGRTICIHPCEGGRDSLGADGDISFHFRDLSDKSHTPFSADQVDEIVDTLGGLIGDGHRFREIRGILEIPSR